MKKLIFLLPFIFSAALITSCKKDEIKLEGTTWQYIASSEEMNVFDTMTLFFKDNKNVTATIGYFDDDYTETMEVTYIYAHPTITLKLPEKQEDKLIVVDKNTLMGTVQISGQKLIFKRK